MNVQSLRHIFSDLDKTLTKSRSLMEPQHQALFKSLTEKKDVVVVTGGMESQILTQIPPELRSGYFMLSQQGNHAEDKNGKLLWEEKVSPEQEEVVRSIHEVFKQDVGLTTEDDTDFFENRGSILATTYVGFHADKALKYAYDPDSSKRLALLARHPDLIQKLDTAGLRAMPAGTTTIDFILKGRDKGYNVARLIEKMGWEKEQCVYIGDALFPGGNDESVVGVIPTYAVQSPEDTFAFIKEILAKS